MKYIELDPEEKALLKAYEQGKFKSAPNLKKEIKRLGDYARASLDKTKNINLRISEADLLKIKSLAVGKGIPYQTLLASLIHQYSAGKIETRVL